MISHETPMRGLKQSLGTLRLMFLTRPCWNESSFRFQRNRAYFSQNNMEHL